MSDALCQSLRRADRDEVQAITGQPPERVLPAYLEGVAAAPAPSSAHVMVSEQGELAGICGVLSVGDGEGSVWMIGTEVLDHHPVEFLRASKAWLRQQQPRWEVLANCVDARNHKHIQWLRWLGFEVEDHTIPFGAERRPFHPFRLITARDPCV